MNQHNESGGWWSYFLYSTLLELPAAVVNAVVCGVAIWLALTFFPPH